MQTDDDEEISFFRRNRVGLIVTGVILVSLFVGAYKFVQASKTAPRRVPELVMIKLPPPPPPPTPPQQPTPEEKVQDEQKIDTPDEKPKDAPVKPPDEPPIGTGIKGNGQGDSFGLTGSNGNGFGNGNGGSRYDWYAGQVQRRIADALRSNSKTRDAALSVKVRVWTDSTGHISRAELANSTGDSSLDQAIRDDVLTGLQVTEAPPDGMPMPIRLRLIAQRPR